jgi:addiction module HigA family antidote
MVPKGKQRRRDSDFPSPPGQVLKEKLVEGMHLTQAQLSRAIGVSAPRLNMILKGRSPISPEIALRIERVFGISPKFWLRIRAEFELCEERQRIARELESLPQHDIRLDPPASAKPDPVLPRIRIFDPNVRFVIKS